MVKFITYGFLSGAPHLARSFVMRPAGKRTLNNYETEEPHMSVIIHLLVYLGSALMIFNIYGFIRFAAKMKKLNALKGKSGILLVPVILLALFLAGYLAVGIFGDPDLIVSGILFGGSVFVTVVYFLLDRITARVIESEYLEAKLMAAEEGARAKNEFLSGVSHEMRTPLNVIIGLSTLSLHDPALSDETRERIEKTDRSAESMLGLVNNILDLNSIETGEFMLKNDQFVLEESIAHIDAIIRAKCLEKGLEYRCELGKGLSGGFIGDDMRIRQILLNLLENAVKFTTAPGTVFFSASRAEAPDGGNEVVFTVRDTGVGIDPDFLPRAFDAFAKEDLSTTSKYGGSGLGLPVAKSIAEHMGGSISVESKKNAGSTFTAVIPLEPAPAPEPSPEGDEPVSLEGKRILLAEDIPENAEIVVDLLDLEGAECEHAENGKIAVDMFNASEPGYYDVVLMDLRMPVMDGITAAKEIRRSQRPDAGDIPIIALTANAFESDVNESLKSGMNAHLSKPADSDKLYETLKYYIKNRGR